MRLHDAARWFDLEPAYNAYDGQFVFKCQFSSFDDSASDGSTSRRRTLSLAPGIEIPTRRVISLVGDPWIVGAGNPDSFQGRAIRQSFGMKKATDLAQILTPAQLLTAAAGTTAYTQGMYFKDVVNVQQDTEIDTFWNMFFAPGEPIAQGSYLKIGTRLLRVRQHYVALEGLRVAQSDELDSDWSQTIIFISNGAYDPVLDEYNTLNIPVVGVVLDTVKFYRWRMAIEQNVLPGDRTVMVAQSAITPVTGGQVTFQGRSWRIVNVQAEMDAWALQVRPV